MTLRLRPALSVLVALTGSLLPIAASSLPAAAVPARTTTVADSAPAHLDDQLGTRWTGGGGVAHTVGRLFFESDDGESSCSANVVDSPNGSVVMTAAHCAYGHDYRFVPGYDDGAAPYGEWRVDQVLAPADFSYEHDYAAMVVETHGGMTLQEVVGASDIAFSAPRPDRLAIFGYPRERANAPEDPYEGRHLTYSSGTTRDGAFGMIGTDSDLSRGVSGGPLLRDVDPVTGTGTQVAVVSGSPCVEFDDEGDCVRAELATYGVPFDDEAERLYREAGAVTPSAG